MKKYLFSVFISFTITLISGQSNPLINTGIIEPTSTVGYFRESFVQHLSSSEDDFFLVTVTSGTTEYFGIPNATQNRKYISRIGVNGQPVWNAIVYGADYLQLLNSSQDIACVDKDDNIYILCKPSSTDATFVDALGTVITFNPGYQKLIKINKDGKLLWSKDFIAVNAGISTDNNENIYLYGVNLGIDFTQPAQPTSLVKMDGINGNVLYKIDFNQPTYQFIPVFDNNDNLYIFTEPSPIFGNENYFFSTGNLNIPLNEDGYNSVMIKFDSSGNPIFGKNFYPVATSSSSYSWINDANFDGTDIIVNGTMITTNNTEPFLGMDGTIIPNIYEQSIAGNIAKIDLNGNLKWENLIQSKIIYSGLYTNFELDEQKNIYAYLTVKDKINYNGVEYNFEDNDNHKIITKLDNNGNLKYFQAVDNTGNNYQNTSYFNYIDVVGIDKLNILGYTSNPNFLNFPLQNTAIPKMYIAHFESKYMGNNENQILTYTISPNPASDFLNIETQAKIIKIELLDMSGKLLKTIIGKNKNIPVYSMNKGTYIIRIYTENGIVNSKFIKN